MAAPAWNMEYAQRQLESKIGLTDAERFWIMKNNQLPDVRKFWSTYKRALNFLYDSDKVDAVKKNLKFLRTIIRSGFMLEDPRYKIFKE